MIWTGFTDRDLDLEDEEAEKQSGSADMSEPDGPQGSRSRSAYLEADRPSHLPTEHLSISKKSTPESDQHPIQRVVVPPTQGAKGSPFQWVKLHTTATNRRLTPLEVLQVVPQSSTNRPALAKAESSSRSASQLIVSAPAACAPSTSSHSSPLIGSVPAGPSLDQSDSSAKMASGAPSPNPLVPPALKAFFDTTRVPLDHLAPIFVQNGFDSDATLDLLCELPPEGHWQDMKDEIMKQGRLAGWLAVQKGLLQRASMLQTQGTS
ncbi:hypothetical protein PHLGIDRAFT_436700 [Phlebiopsis gigantea 11061_1 CR5-6]|uniref:Uncharacterized protein n=1 Tax=Phlebiopsis gigantea (strain 11061_1 CR5-6) TaxID=745531 RepID=A0A0C3SDB7_PHLG1|nr:hypothetical protein PHLGIDRAFT_436700 [Phlebiopsis gigantea 11061_1 CR5-6]